MTMTTVMDDKNSDEIDNLGSELSSLRQQKGYTVEYVASKLHLKVEIIELIEADNFKPLPGAVFIQGYLRAYSKLLGIPADPFIAIFNKQYNFEKKPERALWQSKRESHKAEYLIRIVTILFAVGVMLAVGIWWQKNKDAQSDYSGETESNPALSLNLKNDEIKLTDLSKMQSILSPGTQMTPLEKEGG